MSRNFELLRHTGREQDLFQGSPAATANGHGDKDNGANGPEGRPLNLRVKPAARPDGFVGLRKRREPDQKARGHNSHHGLDLEAVTREEEVKLAQGVFLIPGVRAPRIVLFSGVEHENGCSWVCARAAEFLAVQGEKSVCIVDANLHSPSLHTYFGVSNARGFAEAMVQTDAVANFAQQLPGGNLWLLPSGAPASDPCLLSKLDRLSSRMKELAALFDCVLINAAPANLCADPILLSQSVDGVVLVLEANCTRRETARKIQQSLKATNVPLLGVVLNDRVFPIPEAIYRRL